MLAVAPPISPSNSTTATTTSPTKKSSSSPSTTTTTNTNTRLSTTTTTTTTATTPIHENKNKNMLPSPPATSLPSLAPPSPPSLDLEPSPVYSPLSTPSNSPKPPPSPPLAASGDTCSWDERNVRTKELRNKEKLRAQHAAANLNKTAAADSNQDATTGATTTAATTTTTTAPPTTTTSTTADATTPMTTPSATTRLFPDTDGDNTTALSPDAIALSSTKRLLDLQLARAKRDIITLAEMREKALKEPLQFVEYIASTGPRGGRASKRSAEALKNNIFADKEIPKPQEVYRCPHIEWSKYQILGAPLDAIHEKQRRRPSPSTPAGFSGPAGVPPSMQTGGIIGMPARGGMEYADALVGDAGIMQGRLRMFDGISAQRCVGR